MATSVTRRLVLASAAYLSLPYLIFFAGWLKLHFAVGLIGALALVFASCVLDRDMRHGYGEERPPNLSAGALLGVVTVSLVWSFHSGTGGFGLQNWDHEKHNAMLNELISNPWPLRVEWEGSRKPVVFYLAYYLPSALIGKALCWRYANIVLWIWNTGGLILALSWLALHARLNGLVKAFLGSTFFALASGADIVGHLTLFGKLPGFYDNLEFWSYSWQFSSNSTLLYWVPHQAVSGWIITAWLLTGLQRNLSMQEAGLACVLALFWSPWALIGLIPLVGLLLMQGKIRLPGARDVPFLVACQLLAAAMLSFYSASELHFERGWVWDLRPVSYQFRFIYPLFCALEGVLLCVLLICCPRLRDWRPLLAVTALTLLGLPLYVAGGANDFAMRSSIPALYCLWLLTARAVFDSRTSNTRRALLCLLFAAGLYTPVRELERSLTHVGWRVDPPPRLKLNGLHPPQLVRQYLGREDAFFFRRLATGSEPISSPAATE